MGIIRANKSQVNIVKKIVQETIDAIYPKYYPMGAVNYFKAYHSENNIMIDIVDGNVYLLQIDDTNVGTVTKKGNEVCRLFVLQEYQRKGYGTILLDFIEDKIKEDYSEVLIHSSFPAKMLYKSRGYIETEYNQIVTENQDILCYEVMRKMK